MAAVPEQGPTGLPERVELDLAERAANLYDEKLGDIDRATPYLERMLARQPSNERAFQRLKQILTTREQWGELEALYERVVEATGDVTRRAELLAEVALVAEEITGDRPKAIGYYERILELDPVHEQAVRVARHALRGRAALGPSRAAPRAPAPGRRRATRGSTSISASARSSSLSSGDAAGALSYLEQVLRERPSAGQARQLVEKILDVPELRSRAAIVLEAVYASRDEVPELVRVLEIHLEFASQADERRDLLRRVAELRDERLRDDAGALEAFARLLPLEPDDARRAPADARDRAAPRARTSAPRACSPRPRQRPRRRCRAPRS